jgi:U3 small nucleolar RNA-associated protein 20
MELIHGLTAAPAMAEKHGRDTVPLFLNFARPVSVSDSMDVDVDPSSPSSPVRLSQRLIHLKLICYLELFAKFKNPKALYRSDELYELYLALLAKGENKIQKLSLDCVLTYKSFRITPYRDNLTMLLDEVRFRDQLAKFSLSTYGDAIDPSHRSELIPLVIRLLYGLMITRKGRSSSSQGPAARKQAILASFAGCSSGELQTLVDLMLAPFSGFESEAGPSGGFAFVEGSTFIPGKQQVGYLSLLGDVLKHLGPQLVQSWPRLLGTTMQLVNLAQVQLGQKTVDPASVPEEAEKVEKAAEEEEEDDQEENEGPARAHHTAPTRTIRQIGLKRIADFFRSPVEFDFTPYLPFAFASFISPRLAALDAENTQAPSGLLELFAGWSTKREQIPFLVEYDAQVLPKIYDCLTATNVKPSVISKIYDIVERLLALTAEEDDPHGFLRSRVVQPYVDGLLANLAVLMERPVGLGLVRDELIKRQIRVLSSLATYVSNGDQGARLVALLSPMLRKPIKVVPEKVKVDILIIFSNLFPLVAEFADPSSTFFVHNYNLLSTLFQTLRSRPARQALSSVFDRFADADPSLRPIIDIAISLNSFSTRRMEEPDFDRRLAAFAKLNDELYGTLSVREWLPMIYNMLHHVQDPEELSIRANAAFSMRRFVEVVASRPEEEEFTGTFLRVLYPGLRNGLRSKLELVRTEILSVFVAAVSKCEHIPLMQEMRSLLAGGDDEASFFTNIHHIQTHRRTRALRRLTELCDEGVIRSSTLADIFLPLIAHFIVGAADKMDYSLINEAITATGRISRSLAWGAYNQLVRSYIRLAKEKTEQEKFFIRTVVALLDNFHFAMEEAVPEAEVKSAEEDGEVGGSLLSLRHHFVHLKLT